MTTRSKARSGALSSGSLLDTLMIEGEDGLDTDEDESDSDDEDQETRRATWVNSLRPTGNRVEIIASPEVDLEAPALKLVVETGEFSLPDVPEGLQGSKEFESAGDGFWETL